MAYDAIPGPCDGCGRAGEDCCDHRGRALCQDCWHEARGRETPYAVYRDADGFCCFHGSYLKEEAEERARRRTEQDRAQLAFLIEYRDTATTDASREHYANLVRHVETQDPRWRTYSARPCSSWWGERMAHPAYMSRRRAEVIAAHPEYGS